MSYFGRDSVDDAWLGWCWPMLATFSGYYGACNTGDDAFCEVAAWAAEKFWGAERRMFFSKTLPQLVTRSEFTFPYSSYFAFVHAIARIAQSSYFVSAGGSTFHSALKATDLRTYAQIKKRIGLKGKIGAIGISLGPYRNAEAERSTISYLRSLDYLALRDNRSYQLACSYSLPRPPVRAFDLAALLPMIYSDADCVAKAANLGEQKIVGVSACYYERYIGGSVENERRRYAFLEESIRLIAAQLGRKVRFRFFIFNGNKEVGDAEITQRLIDAIADSADYDVVPYLANVREAYARIGECDVMMAVRLHAGIMACFAGIPIFLFEYHQKCTDFLDDIECSERARIGDAESSPGYLAQQVLDALEGDYPMPRGTDDAQRLALLNFQWD